MTTRFGVLTAPQCSVACRRGDKRYRRALESGRRESMADGPFERRPPSGHVAARNGCSLAPPAFLPHTSIRHCDEYPCPARRFEGLTRWPAARRQLGVPSRSNHQWRTSQYRTGGLRSDERPHRTAALPIPSPRACRRIRHCDEYPCPAELFGNPSASQAGTFSRRRSQSWICPPSTASSAPVMKLL